MKVVYSLAEDFFAAQPLWSAAIYRSFTSVVGMTPPLFPH